MPRPVTWSGLARNQGLSVCEPSEIDIGGDEKFLGEHSVLRGRKKENQEQKKEEKKSDFTI